MTTRSSENQSFDKILEALQVLENASDLNADELKDLIDKKFSNLKNVFGSLNESTRETFHRMDNKVKDNPWTYIGGAAAVGLVLGLILGRRD